MAGVGTILICYPKAPFVQGGTEALVQSLSRQLLRRGYAVDTISLPLCWQPTTEIVRNCMAWRLLDLTRFEGRRVDLAICTKFPSYLVRHPNKVVYLFHQFRQAYDLHGTEYGCFSDSPEDSRIRETIIGLDNRFLPEAKRIFAISGNVSARLKQHNDLDSTVLYPPPPNLGRLFFGECGDYVLSVGRLNRSKRVDLLIRALAHTQDRVRCVVAGAGEERSALESVAKKLHVQDRVQFTGHVTEADLVELYANCLAVFYAPHDEDYGFVAVESFLSKKPVLTTVDAGGVLEFVEDGVTGCVTSPDAAALAGRIDDLFLNRALCRSLGLAGFERVRSITWDNVVRGLVNHAG